MDETIRMLEESPELDGALQQLIAAAAVFLVLARRAHHDQQPGVAQAFGAYVLNGGQVAVRVELGERPMVEAAIVHQGQWHPFARWPFESAATTLN